MSTILFGFSVFLINFATPVSAASLTLTIPSDPLSLDLNPSINNGFASNSGSINVKTDGSSGYTLSIKTKNKSGDNSLMNGSNKISSISESASSDDFKNNSKFLNTWGWLPSKLNGEDNTNFIPGPKLEETILDSTKSDSLDPGIDYNISLGAKVDSSTPTGTYENTFVFTATSNRKPLPTTMQEFTDTDCAQLPEEESITLRDVRDDSEYSVARMKDGKCWMTQNLRITGSSDFKEGHSATLTAEDTDINDGSSFPLPTSSIGSNSAFDTKGDYTSTSAKNNDAAYYGNDKSYGALYTWHTATAGSGTASMTSSGQNAPNSICPKGWRLPTGGSNGDFQKLTTAYSISSNSAGSTTLRSAPLNFTYAGGVDYYGGSLGSQGSSGSYWSSTVPDAIYAYRLYFDSSTVSRASSDMRPGGSSVRCVARDYKSMQNVDEWGSAVKEGETVDARDERDGSTYTVARLADGKLWMTQNLRITGSSSFKSGHSATLTDKDTDINDGSTFPLPTSSIGSSSKFNTNGDISSTSAKNNDAAYYGNDKSYGALYTWHTATAGSGTADMTTQGQNAPNSICPKGWRLPTSGSNGDFQKLTTAYNIGNNSAGSTTLRSAPLNFTYAGLVSYFGGSLDGQGSYGRYWSSTVYDAGGAYCLYFLSSYVDPANFNARPYGFSVRCVAREKNISDLQYLQDWNDLSEAEKSQVLNSMADSTNYTLIDKRDNSSYTVAKLKDGKLWMTQNLKIMNKEINATDSDINSAPDKTFEIPASSQSSFNIGSMSTSSADWKNHKAVFLDSNSSYGGHYTWFTATAGSGNDKTTTDQQNVPDSICPKGWRLPTGGTDANSDYNTLYKYYTTGSQLATTPVPAFTYAGGVDYSNGSLYGQGSGGYYWSSTVYNEYLAYYLYFYSGGVSPTDYYDRPGGQSVRCVAR